MMTSNVMSNAHQNGLSLVNGSRMDRKRFENGAMKFDKLFAVLAFLLTLGVGNVFGTTHTSNFTTSLTYSDGSVTANSATWSASGTVGAGSPSIFLQNVNGNGALNFGTGSKNYYSSITLSTSYFTSYSVSSVAISMSANAACTKTITVRQGATTIGTATNESFSANNVWKTVSLNTSSGTSGDLTISISSGTQSTNINSITVTYTAVVPVTGVTVDPTSKAIVPGQTFTITPTVSPSNATNKNISWGSNATSYATVSSGTVTGVAAGSATITATSAADNTKSASCSVTVYGVTISMVGEDESTVLTGAGIPSAPTRTGASISVDNSTLYGFKKWVISNASLGSAATTQGNTITNPTGSVTLKAVYNAPRTVTWIVNGAEYTPYTTTGEGTDGTSAVQHGKAWSTLTLPTDPDPEDYCGKKFMGWTTTNIGSVGYDKTDDADAISSLVLMTSANKSSMTGAGKYINSNITFYAVFADYAE